MARQEWEMCCAYTYLPLLDEELGSVPERFDMYNTEVENLQDG